MFVEYDAANAMCLGVGSNLAGTTVSGPGFTYCQPEFNNFTWTQVENVAVITSNGSPTSSPAFGYSFFGGHATVDIGFLPLGGNQWQEQLGMSGSRDDALGKNIPWLLGPVTFTVTTY